MGTTDVATIYRCQWVVERLFRELKTEYDLHYEYVATPRRGGRRLWWWPYKEFVNMVRRAAWTALAVRRAVPANRPPDNRSTGSH